MPLINCKIHLESNWTKYCEMSSIDKYTTFQIINTKLYVPIVTLSTKDNVSLAKQLNERFKRSVYWNEYKSKIETKARNTANDQIPRRFPLDASFQGVNRLFVLAFDNTTLDSCNDGPNKVKRNDHRKYFLPRVDITNYNVLIEAETVVINQLVMKSKSMMKLEKLQQENEMITQEDVCWIINISNIIKK